MPDAASESEAPLQIPGESGFWCAEFRGKRTIRGKRREFDYNECYREESTCTAERKTAIKDGMKVAECTRGDRAYCFEATDSRRQSILWRCYESAHDCDIRRAHYRLDEPEPELIFSECVLTAGLDGASPNVARNRRLSSARAFGNASSWAR